MVASKPQGRPGRAIVLVQQLAAPAKGREPASCLLRGRALIHISWQHRVIKWEINGDGFQHRVNEAVALGWRDVHFSTEAGAVQVVGIRMLEEASA